MLTESGRIVAIESDRLWVETINRSTCGQCAAEPGCGQNLLARWFARSAYLPVFLDGRDSKRFQINELVNIGIPEDVIVKSSLLIYCLPLVLLVVGVLLGNRWFATELSAIIGAALGLALGSLLVKWLSYRRRHDRRLRPVLIDSIAACSNA